VTYETVKNWIRQEKLPAYETPVGHHLILITECSEFLERFKMSVLQEIVEKLFSKKKTRRRTVR
jgi:hypothetical protein